MTTWSLGFFQLGEQLRLEARESPGTWITYDVVSSTTRMERETLRVAARYHPKGKGHAHYEYLCKPAADSEASLTFRKERQFMGMCFGLVDAWGDDDRVYQQAQVRP